MIRLCFIIFAHLGMAAIDLPRLRQEPDRRRDLWATAALILFSLVLALAIELSRHLPPSLFRLIEAISKPIGTLLFKPKEG